MTELRKANLTENALTVLKNRYLKKDEQGNIIETPEEMFYRVADCVASAELIKNKFKETNFNDKEELKEAIKQGIQQPYTDESIELYEKYKQKFYDMMIDGYFTPGSPFLMNANNSSGMLFSCFVLPVEDSIDGIFTAIKNTAKVQKDGGGTGFDFSNLRPKGDLITSSNTTTSGAISFMKVFSEATNSIQQGARRRGANMGILSVNHSELIDFIKIKQNLKELTNFNLSVSITDEFIKALIETPYIVWQFTNPRTKEKSNFDCNGKTYTVKQIWDLIIECAWTTGEPGIIFIDEVNRHNTLPELGKITACNPCQPKDSLILDEDKLLKISNYANSWKSWKVGNKEVLELICNNGLKLNFTPEHKLMLEDDSFSEAKNLLNKNLKWNYNFYRTTNDIKELEIINGFLYGDGFSNEDRGILVKINKLKESKIFNLLLKYNFYIQNDDNSYTVLYKSKLDCNIHNKEIININLPKRPLPDYVLYGNSKIVKSFLIGLFEANGSVNKHSQISFKSTNKELIDKVQILLSSFGIPSWQVKNKSKKITWSNGEYISKESYNLQIAPRNSFLFKERIGFYSEYKNSKIKKFDGKYNQKLKVVNIKSLGIQEVWDYQMNQIPNYNLCQGIIASNCGEQMLHPYSSCCLSSINISKLLANKNIDYIKLKEVVETLVRFLDNSIDVNKYSLKEIEEITKNTRNIGLGIMGWADLLYKLNIPYNSQKALDLAEEVMEFINRTAWNYSKELGEEKGSFKYINKSWFSDKIIRNAQVTTIAPSGSISIINGCSGGIEPLFALAFYRNILNGQKLLEVNNIFKEIAEKNNYWGIKDLFKKLAEGVSLQSFKEVPEEIKKIFVIAGDIEPDYHIKMQSVFQKHVSNSISKTINFSNKAKKEDIENAILLAYDLKCKGVTIYRDECRSNQPMAFDKKEEKIEVKKLIKSPDIISAIKIKQKTPLGNMHIKICIDAKTGQELELFAQLGKAGQIPYADLEAIGRLISLFLRNGGKLEDVVKQFEGIGSNLSLATKDGKICSLPDALAEGIKKYLTAKKKYGIKNLLLGEFEEEKNQDVKIEKKKDKFGLNEFELKCPDCNSKLIEEEGCIKCYSCGYSKC